MPVVCIVIGEGGSGGALALGVGNRMLMLENSTYSVISPEGAASILWKDSSLAKSETMKITAPDLLELGIIDDMIKEVKGGAHHDIKQQAGYIDGILKETLKSLLQMNAEELISQRYEKYKAIGKVSVEDQYIGVTE